MVCASVHVWTSYRCIYFHMSNFLYPRWKKCPSAFIEWCHHDCWKLQKVVQAEYLLMCYDILMKAYLVFICSISWSFSILAPFFRLVGHYCRHCNGVLLCHFANKYWFCVMLFSRLNVIASSWIVFLQDIVLHTYLKIIYIFIGVAPYDYIYSSCSCIVCCPKLCDFSHQKRSGDKIQVQSRNISRVWICSNVYCLQ